MRDTTSTISARLLCGAILPALLLAGCSSKSSNENATSSASDTSQTASTNTAVKPSPNNSVATASGGEVTASPEISTWTDNNIVAKLATADKGEVQLGKLAESKATLPAVKAYGRMLVTDHSNGEKEVQALQAKTKLTPQTASSDTTAKANADILKKFTAMPKGTAWDSTFVAHELDDHQHDIADAKAMQNQAKDAQLKQLLTNELPVLQKHLDGAQKLLGNTPGGTAAWKNADIHKTDSTKPKH